MCSGYLSSLPFASAAAEPLQSVCCHPTLSALPKTDLKLELLTCHGFSCKKQVQSYFNTCNCSKIELSIGSNQRALDKGWVLGNNCGIFD